jgi:AcrR family transcriptional regulator
VYTAAVPRLWTETITEHRREVREAILDAAAALVDERGPTAVTMSRIAAAAGIGRATLYKYFPDVEAILLAWHERQVGRHLEQLAAVRDRPGAPGARLAAVLEAYARIVHAHPHARIVHAHPHAHPHALPAAQLHRREHVARAQHRLREFVRDLVAEGAAAGDVRSDVAPDELASYCLHALAAAGDLPSEGGVRRLVAVTLAGLNRPG